MIRGYVCHSGLGGVLIPDLQTHSFQSRSKITNLYSTILSDSGSSESHSLFKASTADIRRPGSGTISALTSFVALVPAPDFRNTSSGNGLSLRQNSIIISISACCSGGSIPDISLSIESKTSRNGLSEVRSSWTTQPRDHMSTALVYTSSRGLSRFGSNPKSSGAEYPMVPKTVRRWVPCSSLDTPKSAIFTHIGVNEATRIFWRGFYHG